jgi:uncharacterized BrkB/YihY/UPF0761 family membrane protein
MPSAADKWRSLVGGVVVIVGLVVVAGVFAGTVWKFSNANEIVAIVGSVTGVVGTMVTAFFGIHATAAAGTDAATAAAYANPEKAGELADKLRGVTSAPESATASSAGAEQRPVPTGPPAQAGPAAQAAPEGWRG